MLGRNAMIEDCLPCTLSLFCLTQESNGLLYKCRTCGDWHFYFSLAANFSGDITVGSEKLCTQMQECEHVTSTRVHRCRSWYV